MIYRKNDTFFVFFEEKDGDYYVGYPQDSFGRLPVSKEVRNAILWAARKLAKMTESEVEKNNLLADKAQEEYLLSNRPGNKQPKPKKPGFVYLAIDEPRNLYKIGFSTTPNEREKQLRTANAGVRFLKTWAAKIEDEKIIHETLRGFGICISGEWYDLRECDIEYLEQYFAIAEMPF